MPSVIIRTITTIALGIGAAFAALPVVTGEAIARDAACDMPLRIGFSDREIMGEWQHRRFIGETAFTAIRKPDGTAAMLA